MNYTGKDLLVRRVAVIYPSAGKRHCLTGLVGNMFKSSLTLERFKYVYHLSRSCQLHQTGLILSLLGVEYCLIYTTKTVQSMPYTDISHVYIL